MSPIDQLTALRRAVSEPTRTAIAMCTGAPRSASTHLDGAAYSAYCRAYDGIHPDAYATIDQRVCVALDLAILELQRGGRVAWIADRSPTGHAGALVVARGDDGAWSRLLDNGTRVPVSPDEPRYWTEGEATEAARRRWRCNA